MRKKRKDAGQKRGAYKKRKLGTRWHGLGTP